MSVRIAAMGASFCPPYALGQTPGEVPGGLVTWATPCQGRGGRRCGWLCPNRALFVLQLRISADKRAFVGLCALDPIMGEIEVG